MAYDFKFPDVGEGITEGLVVEWKVKEGDMVEADQDIVDVETDKAVFTLPSPKKGTILKIHHKEGETIKVGETLVTIGGVGEVVRGEKRVPEKKEEVYTGSVVGVLEEAPEEGKKPAEKEVPVREAREIRKALATPAVRRLARELNVDIWRVEGTGKDGRVTEEDVRRFAEKVEEKVETGVKEIKKYDMYGYVSSVPLKGVRKVVAKKMREAVSNSALVTHHDDADVTHLVEVRERHKEYAAKKGAKLTYIPFAIKAVIEGLKEHPYLNASLEIDGETIILKKYYNIGVAVDTPDGVIVPVIKGADQKTILEIAREIGELAKRAQDRTIDLADLRGGTFTITNIGIIGGKYFTPITNYPESAILGLGRIEEVPVVREGKVIIRHILPLSLSFDHRVIDGAEAARFVNTVKEHLEDPDLFLVEMGRAVD